jgi:hypothetical protein
MCASFKSELFQGYHVLTATNPARAAANTADSFKVALFLVSGSLSPSATTAYGVTSEVSGAGYSAGGISAGSFNALATSGAAAYTTPTASWAFGTVTLSTAFDTALLYNSTQGNRAVALFNFGSQTITAGSFTLTMPTNAVNTALLQIS